MASGGAKAEPEEELSNRRSSGCNSEEWETSEDEGRTKSKNKLLLPAGFLDPLPPKKSSKLPRFSEMVEDAGIVGRNCARRRDASTNMDPVLSEVHPSISSLGGSHRATNPDEVYLKMVRGRGGGWSVEEGRRHSNTHSSSQRENGSSEKGTSSSSHTRSYVGEVVQKCFIDHTITRALVKDLKDAFTHPYPTWAHVPPVVRDILWERFEGRFSWSPNETASVRDAWERTNSRRLSQTLNVARKDALKKANTDRIGNTKGHGPRWMNDVVWDGLILHWASEDWQKSSKVAAMNRQSQKEGGITKHSGGSIPFAAHSRRMEKEFRRAPTKTELFQRTHKKKGTDDYIDNRSRVVAERYEALMVSKFGAGAASEQHEFNPDAWMEATGGLTKGRMYGFGGRSEERNWFPSTSQRPRGSPFSGQPVTRQEIEEIVRRILKETQMQQKQQQGKGSDDDGDEDEEEDDADYDDDEEEDD